MTDRERAREIRSTFEKFMIGEYDGMATVATAAKLEALALAALAAVRAETVEQVARIAEEFPSQVLHVYARGPNDPPGNQMINISGQHLIAGAIRSLNTGDTNV